MSSTYSEKLLWVLLFSLVVGAFSLGFCDPTLRPQVLDFAKVALGGVLTAMTTSAATKAR
jgi:hypothetical protein